MRDLIQILSLLLFTSCGSIFGLAAEPVFEVRSAEDIGFNFPDPPREGAADFFRIAEKGEARCVVIRPRGADRSLLAAISEFAAYLKLVTGAEIRVLEDGAAISDGLGAIHIGETELGGSIKLDLPELRYGDEAFPNLRGFLVRTIDSRTLVIRGIDDDSTAHGLVGFLKRYAGVRQYWFGPPGGIGNVIPDRLNLSIPELEWRDWPYIASFQMSLRSFGPRPYLDFYRRKAALPSGENYNQWLPPSRYADSHPEYYALVNGRRLRPTDEMKNKGWQPCVSNPEVQRVMGEAVIGFFRTHPEAPGINVAINDGGGDCTCADCRALDAPETDYSRGDGMSDRYVFFTNRICEIVGREFPDKWIVYLAYANASAAPQNVKPHPRLLPVITTASTFGRWDEWMRSGAQNLGAYVHHLGTFALLPKTDFHQQAKRFRYLIGSGALRTYYMECHTQWPHADFIPSLTAELLWDPRQDVDELLDEYYAGFYRSAARPMRDYHGVLREGYERWLDSEGHPHWFGKDISSYHQNKTLEQFRVLSPEEAARAAEALEKAAAAAKGDDLVSERIGIVRASFALQKMAIERAWAAYRLRDAKPQSEAEARAHVADARLVFQRQRDARDYIESVLEQPPFEQWKLYRNSSRPLSIYAELRSGEPGTEMRSIVSLGLSTAESFLRKELGEEKASAWWEQESERETVPALKSAFAAAAARALAPEPKNLVTDPGFEEFADEIGGDFPENDLKGEALGRVGVHFTFPDRTPFRCALTRKEKHSGEAALMLEHCARARFTRHIKAEPNTRYRAGLWFRQDEGNAGLYEFSVDVRLKDGSYQTISNLRIPEEPGQWRKFLADVVTPPDTVNLFVRLHITNQAAGTRCWIDDVFVYPGPAD